MGKTLLLKRKLTMLLLAFVGVISAWADGTSGNVLLEADFTTEAGTTGWTTVDKSTKTGTTWVWWQNSFNVGNQYVSAVRIARDWDALDNDYYISTAVELKAGTTYTITTQTGKNNGGILKLEVGTSLTDMSTYKEVKTLSPISTYNAITDEESTFTPETDGTYYFAYHAIQETEGSDYLYLFGMKVAAPGEGGGSTEPDQPETPAKKALIDADFTALTEAPADWSIVDNNNDGMKWTWYKSAIWDQTSFKYIPAFQYTQSKYYTSVDEYLVSSAVELKKGVTYTVTTGAMYETLPGNVTLELGTSATDMSTFTAKKTLDLVNTYADRENSFELTVDNDGTYYFAYHLYQTDGGTGTRKTFITGLKVEAPEEGGSTDPDPDQPETPVKTTVLDADFSTQPTDWTILDKSGSTKNSWNWNGYAFYDNTTYKYFPGFRILQSSYYDAQNDWLISPSVSLKKGVKYTATTASAKEKESATLTLEIGQSTTDVTGYKSIATLTPATAYTDDRFQTFEFTVEEDGEYNLAYHVYEDPTMDSDSRKQKSYVFGLKIEGEETSTPDPDPDQPGTDKEETVIDADFSTQPTDWTILDKSASTSNSWNWNGYAFYDNTTYKYFPGFRILQSSYYDAQNDWLISPSVSLKKGYKYTATTASAKEKESATLTLEIGQSTTDVTGYKSIATLTPATAYTDDRFQNFEFTVDADGEYNLAYHVYEDPSLSGDDRKQKSYVFGLKVVGVKGETPAPAVTPADIADLDAEVNYDEKKVTFTWTNPTKDSEGNDLTEKVGAKIYNGETLVETISELEGETTTYVLSPEPFEGEVTYTVKSFIGDKEAEGVSVLVNMNKPAVTPADVENLEAEVDYDTNKVTLTWVNPTKDSEGNDLTEKAGAKIYNGETLVATIDELEGETTAKELTPESFEGDITYIVKTFIGDNESEGKTITIALDEPDEPHKPGDVTYEDNLVENYAIDDYDVIDANADSHTWAQIDGIGGVSYNSDDANAAADEWLITKEPVEFQLGVDYAISFTALQRGAFDPDEVEIRLLDSNDEAGREASTLVGKKSVEGSDTKTYASRYSIKFDEPSTLAADNEEEGEEEIISMDKYVAIRCITPNPSNGTLSLLSLKVEAIEKATPAAVENLDAVPNATDKTVALTWTNPAKDTAGYDIVGALGVKVYENDELVFVHNNLTPGEQGTLTHSPEVMKGEATYKVVAFIADNESEAAEKTVNLDDVAGEEVLLKSFLVSSTASKDWTILDNSGKGKWIYDYQDVFYFDYKSGSPAEDDWLISPMVYLSSDYRYILKYELKTMLKFPSTIEVTIGKAETAQAQSKVLATYEKLEQNGFAEFATNQFSVDDNADYCIGFHVTEANHGISMRNLRIYGIGVDPGFTGIDEANAASQAVAFNKATGKLLVPAGAKVFVYNANGALAVQTVATDNAINLSALTDGVYVVKVIDAQGNTVNCKIAK